MPCDITLASEFRAFTLECFGCVEQEVHAPLQQLHYSLQWIGRIAVNAQPEDALHHTPRFAALQSGRCDDQD